MAADDEKLPARFGCLAAARWMVASAVTVAIVVVISYSAVAVLKTGDLTLKVVGGHVSVYQNTSSPDKVHFSFNVRAINPSGRIRIYYYGITGRFNSSDTRTFIRFALPVPIVLEAQSSVDTIVTITALLNYTIPIPFFELLSRGDTIVNGMVILNGTRVVENYSGHNKSAEPNTIYYCPPLSFGFTNPEDGSADVECTEHLPSNAVP